MPDPNVTQANLPPAATYAVAASAAERPATSGAAAGGECGGDVAAVAAPPAEAFASVDPLAHVRFWSVAGLGLAADLLSKDWAFRTLDLGAPPMKLVPYALEFQTMLNAGALFGFGHGRTTLFLAASLVALSLVFWMFLRSAPRRWLLHLALGAILGGALGNMHDRLFVKLTLQPVATSGGSIKRYFMPAELDGAAVLREFPPRADSLIIRDSQVVAGADYYGYVRDFIKIPTTIGGRELWPWVFNVADVLLVFGVLVLAWFLWLDRHGPAGAGRSPPRAAGAR